MSKLTYAQCKALGICTDCHARPAAPGHTACAVCIERKRRWAKARWARLKAEGLCAVCGKVPARPGLTMCLKCALTAAGKNAKSYQRRRGKNREI